MQRNGLYARGQRIAVLSGVHHPFPAGLQIITGMMKPAVWPRQQAALDLDRALMLDGRVRPLAFSSDRRTAVLPDIPTFNEALGVDDIVWDAFRFTAAPRGLPADRRTWLVAVLQAVISDPNLAKGVSTLGGSTILELIDPAKLSEEIERRVARERVHYDTKQGLR